MSNMVRMMILVPAPIKAKLEAMRDQGVTASGYIRSLIESDLARKKVTEALLRQREKNHKKVTEALFQQRGRTRRNQGRC